MKGPIIRMRYCTSFMPKVDHCRDVNQKSGSLTPSCLHFLCLSSEGLILLCSAKAADVWLTFIGSKCTTIVLLKLTPSVVLLCLNDFEIMSIFSHYFNHMTIM